MLKRVLFSFVFMFLCVAISDAQELTVKSFQEVTSDLSARTSPRKDINGNDCALVKVRLAADGAKFRGDVVGEVAYEMSEYLVYLASASKAITVTVPNYLPLDIIFADYGIASLKSKTAYSLTVVIPSAIPTVADVGGNFVVMNVMPKNAIVTIDDKPLPVDPSGEYMHMLGYGTHSYHVANAGYISKKGEFDIGLGAPTDITVNLVSALATLTIICKTIDANIYIDKKQVGVSSWTGMLQDGMHLVEIQKEGYRSVQRTVNLKQQQKLTLDVDELVAEIGNLSVAYRPVGADIFIDGKKVGTSPYVFNGIPAGTHKVEISQTGYTSALNEVVMHDGETINLAGNLEIIENNSKNNVRKDVTSINGHEFVDLGLSVKWATTNIGAVNPEEYGDCFAWGEIRSKRVFDWKTYKWSSGTEYSLSKYSTDKFYGAIDGKIVLDNQDDVANVKWGGGCRMPTKSEQDELLDLCIWTWTVQKGVKGYKVVSKINGNAIFLPAAGFLKNDMQKGRSDYGFYWSSSLYQESYSHLSYSIFFDAESKHCRESRRCIGGSVRAVCK